MNCLEAQSKIVAFIEDKLDNGEKLEFIRHIRGCSNCAEELEIYYTLMVGMKQLDDDIVPTISYKEQMKEKLNSEYKHLQNRRKLTGSTIVLIVAACITMGFFAYESHQEKVYQEAQSAIKTAQSEYYYYDYFGEKLFHPDDYKIFDLPEYLEQSRKTDTTSYYERLQKYLQEQAAQPEEGESNGEETTAH